MGSNCVNTSSHHQRRHAVPLPGRPPARPHAACPTACPHAAPQLAAGQHPYYIANPNRCHLLTPLLSFPLFSPHSPSIPIGLEGAGEQQEGDAQEVAAIVPDAGRVIVHLDCDCFYAQ